MRIFILLLLGFGLPTARAEIADLSSSLCTDDSTWDRKGQDIKASFPSFDASAATSLKVCGVTEIPGQSKKTYWDRIDANRKVYCNKQSQAQAKYTAASSVTIDASSGQTCDPLKQTATLVTDAKTALLALQNDLKATIADNHAYFKKLIGSQAKLLGECPQKIQSVSYCQELDNKLAALRNGGSSIAETAAVRDDPENQCNKDLSKLALLLTDHKAFWDKDAAFKNREYTFASELRANETKLHEITGMESQLNAAMTKQGCPGAVAASVVPGKDQGPTGGATVPAKDDKVVAAAIVPGLSEQKIPVKDAMDVVPTSKPNGGVDILNAKDMSACYSGSCSKDTVLAQQKAINQYIADRHLPISPIAEDGIAGTQTANAWRAATLDMNRVAAGTHTNPAYYNNTITSYKAWDTSATVDKSTGYVIFRKGTKPNLLDYFLSSP